MRARPLRFTAIALGLVVLHGCGNAAGRGVSDAGAVAPEPLPVDMLRACPGIESFKRTAARPCTEIGCVNGYRLSVSPDSGWAQGAYRFELTIDGRNVTCEGTLPLKACAERSFSCDAQGVSLGESGCALGAAQQGIATIAFDSYPLELSIRVLRDGAQLASARFTPGYVSSQPNGAGCSPVCCGASGELTVSPAQP